jgi:hypothetical protein
MTVTRVRLADEDLRDAAPALQRAARETAPGATGVFARTAGQWMIRWAARKVLIGRSRDAAGSPADQGLAEGKPCFTAADVDRLMADAWQRYVAAERDFPEEATFTGRMSVAAAAIVLAVFEALLADGIDRAYALELAREISWQPYKNMGRVSDLFMRAAVRGRERRLKVGIDMTLKYMFSEPAYRQRRVPVAEGQAWETLRCPFADYLGSRGASDLCVAAFCSLDFRLVEQAGFRLERTGTLASGATHCDFRVT